MIQNWKLFLENSNEDDEQVRKDGEVLKTELKKNFSKLFFAEFMFRLVGDKEQLEIGVEVITQVLVEGFIESLNTRDFNEEFKELMIDSFTSSLDEAKAVMVDESFAKGIDIMIDNFIQILIDLKKAADSEGEEWKEEKEKEYSDMSKSEINDLIDQALDDRDFAKVKFLSQFLKESVDYNPEKELKEISKIFANLILDFVEKYSKVK